MDGGSNDDPPRMVLLLTERNTNAVRRTIGLFMRHRMCVQPWAYLPIMLSHTFLRQRFT